MPKSPAEPADTRTPSGRLRWARENWVGPLGVRLTSPRDAARYFEWNENTYKSHENGVRAKRGISDKDLAKYARAFKVNAGWLAAGVGPIYAKDDLDHLSPEERARALKLLKAAD